ncbi:MAG: diacylglycerol kinase family protein [Alphaproteobacteria bacterium]
MDDLRMGAAPARRLLVIHNPAAGGWRRKRRFARALAELERLGCHVEVRRTDARGDAERLARAARTEEFDLVVAAGGDGTINEVVNGLVQSGLPLGVIPLGTANVFASEIGLPSDIQAAASFAARAPIVPVHVGRANGRCFSLMAGAGFDALVVAGVDGRLKRLCGKCAYVTESLFRMAAWRSRPYVVTVDGSRHEAASIIVAKGRYYAGRYVVAPSAHLSLPSFQVVLFRKGGRLAVMRYGIALLLNVIPRLPDVEIVEGRSVEIEGPPGEPVQGDGDIVASLPLRVAIADRLLRVAGALQAPATVMPSTRRVGASVP